MRFEWDERKRQENLRKHGLDFGDVPEPFLGPMLVKLDTRMDYGEDRWVGIGVCKNRVVVVVYVEDEVNETIRVISLRKALSHERQRYEEYLSD